MLRYRMAALLSVLLVGAVAWPQTQATAPAAQPSITGSISYVQRMALPPDAAIEVKLEDTSGATPTTVASTVFAMAGKQVPVPFQLQYNPADINSTHNYALSANISVNGKPRFVSTTAYPVLTNGAPGQVNMVLQPAPAQSSKAKGGAKLYDTSWKLVELNGQAVVAGADGKPPHIYLLKKGELSGSTGCNSLTGSFIAEQSAMQFTPAATTMRVCSQELTAQEQAFVLALKATMDYKIEGDTLEFVNGQQVLAKFQTQPKAKK